MRDRLIELIASKVCEDYSPSCDEYVPHSCEKCYANSCRIGEIADNILANGGILPLCKVGDEVWFINYLDEIVYIGKIHDVGYNGCSCIYRIVRSVENGGVFAFSDYEIGKSVFLARKEAEQALKGAQHEE